MSHVKKSTSRAIFKKQNIYYYALYVYLRVHLATFKLAVTVATTETAVKCRANQAGWQVLCRGMIFPLIQIDATMHVMLDSVGRSTRNRSRGVTQTGEGI